MYLSLVRSLHVPLRSQSFLQLWLKNSKTVVRLLKLVMVDYWRLSTTTNTWSSPQSKYLIRGTFSLFTDTGLQSTSYRLQTLNIICWSTVKESLNRDREKRTIFLWCTYRIVCRRSEWLRESIFCSVCVQLWKSVNRTPKSFTSLVCI